MSFIQAGNFYYNSIEYVIDPDTSTAHHVSTVDHTVYEIEPGKKKPVYVKDEVKVVVGKAQPCFLYSDLHETLLEFF